MSASALLHFRCAAQKVQAPSVYPVCTRRKFDVFRLAFRCIFNSKESIILDWWSTAVKMKWKLAIFKMYYMFYLVVHLGTCFCPVISLKAWNEHEQSAPRQSFIVAFRRHCCCVCRVDRNFGWWSLGGSKSRGCLLLRTKSFLCVRGFLHATSKLASANFLAVYPRTLSDRAHLIPPAPRLLIKMNALRV